MGRMGRVVHCMYGVSSMHSMHWMMGVEVGVVPLGVVVGGGVGGSTATRETHAM